MNVGKHQHKGIDVWYNDHMEVWECELDRDRNPNIQREKLVDLRKRIDDFVKKEKKFERFTVIKLGSRWGSGEAGDILTVTSITDNGEYWTVDDEGKRSRESTKVLASDTPENRAEVTNQIAIIKQSGKASEAARDAIIALAIDSSE